MIRGFYRRAMVAVFLVCLEAGSCVFASDSPNLRHFPAEGSLHFVLHDDINLPFYSWPRTLLSYPVDFSAAQIHRDQLRLFDDSTGKPVALQLSDVQETSDGMLKFARVCFLSDLKPGATVSFELKPSDQAAPVEESVTEHAGDGFVEVDSDKLQIRIPQSRRIAAGDSVPAPILAINRGQGWIGDNHLLSPVKNVLSVTTQSLADGPLFRSFIIRYEFAGGGSYAATVKIVTGYPFVDFAEQMNGLAKEDAVELDMNWSGFKPTLRFPAQDMDHLTNVKWMGIDEPIITPDLEEDPKWLPGNEVEDPSKDMAFELAAYSGNGVRDAAPVVSFWEDGDGGSELSVFALNTLGWQDHQYRIWQPSTDLQVHFRHDSDGNVHWTWPLVTGSRSTGIALEDAANSQKSVLRFVKSYSDIAQIYGKPDQVQDMRELRLRNAQLLRSWYGTLSLDRVKDMVLTYPDQARQPPVIFDSTELKSADELAARMKHTVLALYPLGNNLVAMDIRHRELYDTIMPAYNRFRSQLSDADKKRAVAVILLGAYMNSSDDLAAVRICLGGTPNMCADGFSVPAEVTFLFPDHPMAASWRDQFEKTLRLMGCFYTRPDVPAWDSLGGRWTESLSVYNWAYLRPTELGQFCAESGDHRDRFANPYMAMRGRWLVDELTAPIYNPTPYWRQESDPKKVKIPPPPPLSSDWKPGMPLSADFGFDRQYAPHGAHGSGTGILVPWQARYLGDLLLHYDPMVAEHLLWANAQANSHDAGELSPDSQWAKQLLASAPPNSGTEPRLESCKYTGHGIILRAGVDTPEELSIHLDQVDQGPNYRWGDNGQGSCGVLYFYAGGKVWSGHERENTGDHYEEETVGETNFGFMKGGKYRGIGANTLDRPLYDLTVAQFAQLKSLRGPGAYSWPQYDSRSVLLVGTDYFAILDRTPAQPIAGSGRFSWFQARDLPFPKLIFLKPLDARVDHWSEVRSQSAKGITRDADGSSLVLATHKGDAVEMRDMNSVPVPFIQSADMRTYSWRKGVKPVAGVWPIKAPHSSDLLFIDDQPISCALPTGEVFKGSAGVIRRRDDGATEMAIFAGSRIGTKDLTIDIPPSDETGVSVVFSNPTEISGQYYSPHGLTNLTLTFGDSSPANGLSFFIDGAKQSPSFTGSRLVIPLAAGNHHWQLTAHLPRPMPVNVTHTENFAGGSQIYFDMASGADTYELQLSTDSGQTWQSAGKSGASPIRLAGLKLDSKVHVRLIASNAEQSSDPGESYPIYISNHAPDPPDGLYLHLSPNRVDASWGKILGVGEYHLYRRRQGEGNDAWKQIYSGPDQSFSDSQADGVVIPNELPGPDHAEDTPRIIYEYAITAVNGIGEGVKSPPTATDPSGWPVWWPAGQPEQFKRRSAYWMPPYVAENQVPPARYP